ncbi:MAG: hypothetical protein M3Y29_06170 [Chloroflexota bacterium]|nr:hypothetical protein [Chloroflexota bacterium]
MIDRDDPQGPGQGPLDDPHRDAGDPIGDDAYPGGQMLPPTADLDDPVPETGMPGEPELNPDQLEREEELGPEDEPLPG